MNLYEEHYEILKKYKEANKNYNKVLEKKALLVLKTQPGAVDTTKEIVDGNRNVEGFVVNYNNIISKYVRMKNGKMKEHFDREKENE